MGSTGQEQKEGVERTWNIPQKQTGCLQAACYHSAGSLASDEEEGSCTPHTELPSPGLDSPRMGESVLAPRPCFMAGHGFQKGQEMVAGRKASTIPTTEHLPCLSLSSQVSLRGPSSRLPLLLPSPGQAAFCSAAPVWEN